MKPTSTILALIICLSIAGIDCRKLEEPYRFYATANEAVNAGERERGWFPDFIPNCATEIHIQNNVDNQQYWIRFNLRKTSSDSLKQSLILANAETVKVTKPFHASWWFEGLIEQQPANDNALHSEVFVQEKSSNNRIVTIAFDKLSNTIFVWSF